MWFQLIVTHCMVNCALYVTTGKKADYYYYGLIIMALYAVCMCAKIFHANLANHKPPQI